jgi:aminoglycoside phosphotransferase (APT) family kinase protein
MNEQQLRILNSLKEACADPIVNQSTDEKLKTHLAEIGILATQLLVDLVTVPELRKQAMRSFAALMPEIEKFLGTYQLNTDAARKLAQLGASGDAMRFETCLGAAREVQFELRRIDTPQAMALQKKLALVEGAYGKGVLDAIAAQSPQNAAGAPAVAGQTKDFDQRKLNDFILKSFPEEKGAQIVESKFISGGSSKYTMTIQLAGVTGLPESIVLRGDSITSAGYGGASSIDEYRLLKILYAHGVCVPKPLAVEASGTVFGSPFMLVEKRPGGMIGHMFDLPPPNKVTGCDVAQKLAAIHCVPVSGIGDWVRGANVQTSKQVAATIEESYANWQALQRPSPMFEAAFKWLRENVEIMDRSRGLVHGDYGLQNLLIDNGKVAAVLDWEFFHIGNPAYDLGYFYYQAESLCSWQEFLDAYAGAGAPLPTKEELDFSILFAATRLGVMVVQSHVAFRTGVVGGLFMALSLGRCCYEVTLIRLNDILKRIL